MNLKTMFAFKGTEHQPSLYIGLSFVILGLFLIITGQVHWGWAIAAHITTCFYLYWSSVGFHRLIAHNAFRTNDFWRTFCLLLGTLGCYGSGVHFRLSHIRHHIFSDTEDDPQQFETLKDVFLPSYIEKPATVQEKRMLIKGFKRWPMDKFFHQYYWLIVLCFVLFLFLVFGWQTALYLWAWPVGMTIFTGRLFNLWAHDGMEKPTNVWWWGLMFGFSGEHLHRNHHDSPGSWDYREKPWHLDGGSFVVWTIMKNRPSFMDFITLRHKLNKRQIKYANS